jgi:hypothetical protein
MINHANKYDTLEVWCDAEHPFGEAESYGAGPAAGVIGGQGPPESLDDVTCGKCLDAIMAYAGLAMVQQFVLAERRIAEMKAAK